jgi:hypothetical protein
MDNIQELANPLAWHYTGTEGLLGILTSNRLWASDPVILNDRRELSYGLDVVLDEWRSMRSTAPSELRDYIDELLSDEWQEFLRRSIFLVSASSSPDLAAQWLNYAGVDGFAVGLDRQTRWWPIPEGRDQIASGVLPIPLAVGPVWFEVDYNPEHQQQTARELLVSTLQTAGTDSNRSAMQHLRTQLATGVVLFKHPAFSDEREIRLAIPDVGNTLRFRSSSGRLIPFHDAACYEFGPPDLAIVQRLPIKEVVCAPGTRDASLATVRRLLAERGHATVPVRRSEVPL